MVKKTILIIEDDNIISDVLVDRFSGESDFNTYLARDGEEGLKTAKKLHPDLILLDLILPKMSGIELFSALKKDEWGKNAKVIILTNLSDVEKTNKDLAKEACDILIKTDLKLEDLVKKVKETLGAKNERS